MRRAGQVLVIVFVGVALALWLRGSATGPMSPSGPTEDRIPKLKEQIAEQEVESAKEVAEYTLASKVRIDDIDSPVADLLWRLPGVVYVEVGVAAAKPTSRIIHLRDWHSVPKELYALDMKSVHGRELTDDEIDRLHQELLLQVELVQVEQMAVLRCLVKHHGLKKVLAEGFSPKELEAYRERIAVLRSMENEQVPQVRKQLVEVRSLIDGSTGGTKEKAQAIEAQLVMLLDNHKYRLLEMGAAGRLLISSELEDVLPLEDGEVLEKAKPVTPSGGVELDPVKVEVRHDAQVKHAMAGGPVVVIVLGGSHDLSASVRRLGGGKCEYLRLTTKRFREIAE